MSYGKMNGFALIKQLYKQKDEDGFTKDAELILAKVRCYREGRHGSARWANLSTFTQATDLFRIRVFILIIKVSVSKLFRSRTFAVAVCILKYSLKRS